MSTQYLKQGEEFLAKFGFKFTAVRVSPNTAPKWADKAWKGQHWYIRIERQGSSENPPPLEFDFWTGHKYDKAGKSKLAAYDVLACISSDLNCPETFADFCSDYGYDSDSIKARSTFEECYAFSRKLRGFFTSEEQTDLAEIQ